MRVLELAWSWWAGQKLMSSSFSARMFEYIVISKLPFRQKFSVLQYYLLAHVRLFDLNPLL